MPLKKPHSPSNVFRDLGFPRGEAEHLRIRADLLIDVQQALAARGLTQKAAAEVLGVHQPRVSDVVRGRVERFSIETLIEMLGRLGVTVKLVVRHPRRRSGAA